MHPRHLVPAAVLPLVVLAASPAYAAPSINYGGGSYSYHGDATAEIVTVACVAGFVVPAPSPDPAPCGSVTTMSVEPSAGADSVNLGGMSLASFPLLPEVRINVSGDDEVDTVTGWPGRDSIVADNFDSVNGGAGNDHFTGGLRVDGGDGNDTFEGVYAAQGAYGGGGDDRFVEGVGPVNGGTGEDSYELDFQVVLPEANMILTATGTLLSIHASLGSETQDASNPLSDIEHLDLTFPNLGTHTFDGSTFTGDAVVRGFGGPETLIGTKQSDVLRSGAGDDTIDAQDGAVDIVRCGAGTDSAKVDVIDTVSGCEAVTYPNPETSAIKGPRKVKKGAVATFKFSSPVIGAKFQCKVDKKAWKSCTSPYAVKTAKLKTGKHILQVRAVYPAGNPDVTPSKKRFKVT